MFPMHRIIVITAGLFAFLPSLVLAQESAGADPLFQDGELLNVTLTAPLRTLVRERPKDDYLAGVFRYTEADGTVVEFDTEIRTRGHFRHDNCDFPPIRLNFKKEQTDGTLFDQQDKMKLVVHCDDSNRYEQIVLREYLTYRILNSLTDLSFRVRLLRVTYVDSEERRKEQVRYAFLIEHKNRLAARHGLANLEIARTSVSAIQGDQLNLTSVFSFLIGNTDFSPIAGPPGDGCCHNYVLFKNDVDPILAIPYDFDQSGFVDAPYATPNEMFRIRTVRQRLYRGRCNNNIHVPASLQTLQDNRAAIYALIAEQEGLDDRVRKTLVKYVDGFYKVIDDPKGVERKILKACVG